MIDDDDGGRWLVDALLAWEGLNVREDLRCLRVGFLGEKVQDAFPQHEVEAGNGSR